MMSPSGYEHGVVAGRIHGFLFSFVRKKRLGMVTAAETGFQIGHNPDTVRTPDVGFIRADRVPSARTRRILSGAAGPGRRSGFAHRPRWRSVGEGAKLAGRRLPGGLGRRSEFADDDGVSRFARARHCEQHRRVDRRCDSARVSAGGGGSVLSVHVAGTLRVPSARSATKRRLCGRHTECACYVSDHSNRMRPKVDEQLHARRQWCVKMRISAANLGTAGCSRHAVSLAWPVLLIAAIIIQRMTGSTIAAALLFAVHAGWRSFSLRDLAQTCRFGGRPWPGMLLVLSGHGVLEGRRLGIRGNTDRHRNRVVPWSAATRYGTDHGRVHHGRRGLPEYVGWNRCRGFGIARKRAGVGSCQYS